MTSELDFKAVDQALTGAETGINASESHGTLCGLLCAQQPFDAQIWLLHTLIATDSENSSLAETRNVLGQLAESTARQLTEANFGFTVLLPDDEQSLQIRTQAVSQWCQGFLEGLRLAQLSHPENLAGDAGEVMCDIIEISKAARFQVEDNNENEADFAELVEFLRAGIQLVYEELHPAATPANGARKQLH